MKKWIGMAAAVLISCLLVWAAPTGAANDDLPEAAIIDAEGNVLSTYATLEEALTQARKNSGIVRLEKDTTLSADVTVPKNVTLVIPCMDHDPGYMKYGKYNITYFNHNGTSLDGTTGVGPHAYLYRKLTIENGVTLYIDGTLMVNSVSGRPSGGTNEMDIPGGYSEIDLTGEIVVSDSGTLECFGYIRGSGLVTAEDGAVIGDLFIVRHWRGGTHGYAMYEANVYPINEFDCCNIEADLRLEYGAELLGMVKMNADDGTGNAYYYTRFPQVSADDSSGNAMIRLVDSKNGYILRSFDAETQREHYEVHGGAKFANSRLYIISMFLTSADFLYPIDGDMDFTLCDGEYTFVNDHKVMPGATMTVEGDASLRVDEGITLVFYDDTFQDPPNTGNSAYPADRSAAMLTLENGASFVNGGYFAGKIYTNEANIIGEPHEVEKTDWFGDTVYDENDNPVYEMTPVWKVETFEANGYCAEHEEAEDRVLAYRFELDITRPGYRWEIKEDGNILWIPAVEDEFIIEGEAAEDGTAVTVCLSNLTETDESRIVMAAAYNEEEQMLAADISDVCLAEAGEYITVDLELNTTETIEEIRLFVLDPQTKQPQDIVQDVPLK